MTEIDIISRLGDEPEWLEGYRRFVESVLEAEELHDWEISLTICHDDYIRELNLCYREKDEPTDVLSFCQNEGDEVINFPGQQISAGDIIISMDTLARHAAEFGVSEDEELKRVTIHGILHLKGMVHETRNPEEAMLKHQEDLLKNLGDIKVLKE